MSTYDERIAAFTKFANAAKTLLDDYAELFLSLDVQDTFSKVRAIVNLRDTIEPPQNEQEAYGILASVLGELLASGRVVLKPYGLSALGNEEFRELTAPYAEPEPPAVDPLEASRAEFADVIQAWGDPAVRNKKFASDEKFRRRVEQAQSLGLIQ
jgi:hypothetical protein